MVVLIILHRFSRRPRTSVYAADRTGRAASSEFSETDAPIASIQCQPLKKSNKFIRFSNEDMPRPYICLFLAKFVNSALFRGNPAPFITDFCVQMKIVAISILSK